MGKRGLTTAFAHLYFTGAERRFGVHAELEQFVDSTLRVHHEIGRHEVQLREVLQNVEVLFVSTPIPPYFLFKQLAEEVLHESYHCRVRRPESGEFGG